MKKESYYCGDWICSAAYGNKESADKWGPFIYILHPSCNEKGVGVDGYSGVCKACNKTSPAYLRMLCLVIFKMI